MIRGLENLSYEDKLRQMVLFRLEKKGSKESLQYKKEVYKMGRLFFAQVCTDRTSGRGFKLKQERIRY